MINKSVMIRTMILMLLTLFCGCSINNENNIKLKEGNTMSIVKTTNNKIKPIKLAIFPTGMVSDAYLFDLDSYGFIEVKEGNKKSDDIDDASFIEPITSKSKKLTDLEQEDIVKLVEELEKDKTVLEKVLEKGGWEVIISIGNNKYNFNYGDYENISYGKLVKSIINYSPLKIDIHGWS